MTVPPITVSPAALYTGSARGKGGRHRHRQGCREARGTPRLTWRICPWGCVHSRCRQQQLRGREHAPGRSSASPATPYISQGPRRKMPRCGGECQDRGRQLQPFCQADRLPHAEPHVHARSCTPLIHPALPCLHPPDSPVSIDSSTYDVPSTTSPSAGTREPGSNCSEAAAAAVGESAAAKDYQQINSSTWLWAPVCPYLPIPPLSHPTTTAPRPLPSHPQHHTHLEQVAPVHQGGGHLAFPHHSALVVALQQQGAGGRKLAQTRDGLRRLTLGLGRAWACEGERVGGRLSTWAGWRRSKEAQQ